VSEERVERSAFDEAIRTALEQGNMGHYEAAIEGFKAALELSTDDKVSRGIWKNIAVCHMRLGQIEEASAAVDVAGVTTLDDDLETWADLHDSGAADAAVLGSELADSGDFRGALAAFDAALHDPGLDDDTRGFLHSRIAYCHLELLDWGRAEESAAVMDQAYRQSYERRRAELMARHDVSAADLPNYDGSAYDDEFSHAKARFETRDYAGALEILGRIVEPTADLGSFGEEVRLYVALCHLYTGDTATGDGWASHLTGAWADSYYEHRNHMAQV
jgi:tetratricopeptide (TPR) repeat protein